MDWLRQLPDRVLYEMSYPFSPEARIYWLYLLGAMVMAFVVHRTIRRTVAGADHSFLRYLCPKTIYLHPSAIVDYKYYVVGRLIRAFGLVPLLVGAPTVARWTEDALEGLFGAVAYSGPPGPATLLLYTLVVMVAFDLGVYIAHFLQHRLGILWEFHKVHHSAQVLTPLTLYRMHPCDDVVAGLCASFAIGTTAGAFSWGLGGPVSEVLAGGVNLALFLFYVFGYNLRHSHVWLHYPGWLSRLVLSPAQHQIHHSRDVAHLDKNFGLVFSFWDRMAGTLYVPVERETLELGLGGGEDAEYQTVAALYLLPFHKAARRILRPFARTGRSP